MAVITISRQFGSGGDEIASRLCEVLGYQLFDKRLIAQAAAETGLSEQEIIDYSEDSHKVRTFLDRLFNRSTPVAQARVWREDATGARITEEIKVHEDVAVTLVQKAIRSAYRAGNMIIIGRGGQVVLKERPDVLHVRIECPMEERIQRVRESLRQQREDFHADIELRRQAQDMVLDRDAASIDYIKRFYEVDLNDSLLYHLVINTGKVTIEQAVEIIARLTLELGQAETKGEELAPA